MKKLKLCDKAGSAMVAAIIVAVVIGLWMAAAMQSSFAEYKMSARYLAMQNALNLAESGLEEGVRAFNDGTWSGWTEYSKGYFLSLAVPNSSGGGSGALKVFVSKSATAPVLAAEGAVTGVDGRTLRRQIKVDLSSSSLYANGLLARRKVVMNGNGITVDSWDSRVGNYSSSTRNSNGNVASLSMESTDLCVDNGNVYGFLSVGSSSFALGDLLKKNGILGEWGDASGDQDPGRVTKDFYVDLPAVTVPDYSTWIDVATVNGGSSDVEGSLTLGSSLASVPTSYYASSVKVSGNGETLLVDGPVRLFVDGDVAVSGKAKILISGSGSLELYTSGSIDLTGQSSGFGLQNSSKKPENFMIYNLAASPAEGATSGSNEIKIAGNGGCFAVIYAPNSEIKVAGNGEIHGALVGYNITLNGGALFHYDEALADLGGGGGLNIDFWRELKAVGEQLPFDDPLALNSSF